MSDSRGSSGKSENRDSRIALLFALLGLALFVALSVHLLLSTSPYIDTAFQIRISREPSLADAMRRIVGDNQAPAAQVLFWAGARLGLESIASQRALSLVVSSAAYVGAILLGFRWRRSSSTVLPDKPSDLVLISVVTILSPGVFVVSSMVRYSSLAGAIWLVAFILTLRSVKGEHHLIPRLGLVLGLGTLVSYSVGLTIVCVVIALAVSKSTRSPRLLLGLLKGLVAGSAVTLLWLLYAGSEHLSNIMVRGARPLVTTARSIIGHVYELVAWLLTGPSSLPSFAGLVAITLIGSFFSFLLLRPPRATRLEVGTVAIFAVLPIPLLLALKLHTGWSMAGPAAVVALVVALAAAQLDRWKTPVSVLLILATAAVAALPAFGIAVLRPLSYFDQASTAVERALLLSTTRPVLLVSGTWTTELLADEASQDPHIDSMSETDFLAGGSSFPSQIVVIFNDPVEAEQVAIDRELVREKLTRLGYNEDGPTEQVGRYADPTVLRRLGLARWDAQYVIEIWSRQ